MKIEQAHIDQIRKQFAELQSKEDLVKLLSDAKKMLYGAECKPVQLKSLTYYANPKLCKKRYQTFTIKKKVGCRQNHPCTCERIKIYSSLSKLCVTMFI